MNPPLGGRAPSFLSSTLPFFETFYLRCWNRFLVCDAIFKEDDVTWCSCVDECRRRSALMEIFSFSTCKTGALRRKRGNHPSTNPSQTLLLLSLPPNTILTHSSRSARHMTTPLPVLLSETSANHSFWDAEEMQSGSLRPTQTWRLRRGGVVCLLSLNLFCQSEDFI